jgi:hypothetical protein
MRPAGAPVPARCRYRNDGYLVLEPGGADLAAVEVVDDRVRGADARDVSTRERNRSVTTGFPGGPSTQALRA